MKDASGAVLQTVTLTKTAPVAAGFPTTALVVGIVLVAAVLVAVAVIRSRQKRKAEAPGLRKEPPSR